MRRTILVLVATLALSGAACATDTVLPTEESCDVGSSEVLAAQSVPTATAVPCIGDLDEWRTNRTDITSSGSVMELSTRDGDSSWRIDFTDGCRPADVAPTPWPGEADVGAQVYEQIDEGSGRYRVSTWLVFDGGCVESRLEVPDNRLRPVIVEEAREALGLLPRSVIDAHVERTTDGELRLDP